MLFLKTILKWLTGGFLDRALGTVDKYVENQTDKEKIKADVVKSYYATRASWLQAGGFWLLLLFAVPVALWFGSVVIYSMLWCADCAFPQEWTIASLPHPLNEWAGYVIIACIGGAGVFTWKK